MTIQLELLIKQENNDFASYIKTYRYNDGNEIGDYVLMYRKTDDSVVTLEMLQEPNHRMNLLSKAYRGKQ
jgi:hypothetical protein